MVAGCTQACAVACIKPSGGAWQVLTVHTTEHSSVKYTHGRRACCQTHGKCGVLWQLHGNYHLQLTHPWARGAGAKELLSSQ